MGSGTRMEASQTLPSSASGDIGTNKQHGCGDRVGLLREAGMVCRERVGTSSGCRSNHNLHQVTDWGCLGILSSKTDRLKTPSCFFTISAPFNGTTPAPISRQLMVCKLGQKFNCIRTSSLDPTTSPHPTSWPPVFRSR
ncbi:hypothetical protein VTK26DRAFT_5948 [Humicola hyalothermophila]